MKKIIGKYFWTFLVVISALGLAICAAYFSISGLSKLFAGSAEQVIIMASFLEFSKIATTAVLHRFWNSIRWILKIPLTIMVIVIMAITSSGIYGFLAEAYTSTSNEMQKIESQIELIEKQKEQKREQIASIEDIRISKSSRVASLVELRTQQESRIDSLYNRRMVTSARQTQALIDRSSEEIALNQRDIDSLTNAIQSINMEIGQLDIDIIDLQNTDIAAELGPLKYMANITGKSMESVINWFIMGIMLAFDPLAVLLVVLANNVYDSSSGRKKTKKNKEKKESDTELPKNNEEKEETKEGIREEHQQIIDVVNNANPDILDFSYDFIPEERGDEVVEYIESENGNFQKSNKQEDKISSLIKGIDSNPLYIQLLDVFYLNGKRNIGDVIPPYEQFIKDIKSNNINCDEKVVKNFLTISNLLGIVNMADKNKVTLLKDYKSARQIISLVSK